MPLADEEDALVARALAERGVLTERIDWEQGVRHDAAACVVRTTWNYHERLADFLRWADAMNVRTPVYNHPRVLRWNSHKGYLLDLARSGVHVPPTELLERGTAADLAQLMTTRGWERVMLKPAVGVGALGSMAVLAAGSRAGQAHLDELLATGDALVQPYLERIHSDGEVSLVYLGGEFSHAVRKVPAPGDYRAHPYWGAIVTPHVPARRETDTAVRALAAVGEGTLYARVDLVALDDGTPAVIELELIEPYLFLDGDSSRHFAAAITSRVT